MPVKTMIAFEEGRRAASCGRDRAAISKDFIAFSTELSTAFSTNSPSAFAVLGSTPLHVSSSIDAALAMIG